MMLLARKARREPSALGLTVAGVLVTSLGACAHGTTIGDGGGGAGGDGVTSVVGNTSTGVTSATTGTQSTSHTSVTSGNPSVTSVTSASNAAATVASSSTGQPLSCGDFICSAQIGETCASCPSDCTTNCCVIDGVCNTAGGETAQNCPSDCATTGCNDPCVSGPAEDPVACANDPQYGPCVDDVCNNIDSYCCTGLWDSICVSEATSSPSCTCP